MKLSYLVLDTVDPAHNLAVEQYVFEYLPRDRMYFMLWQNDNAIIIGKHQNTHAEINTAFVEAHGIKVVRRLSGGGAVYHDMGNLNFTFIADADNQHSLDFALFCQPVAKALKEMGVDVQINGRNDMTIDGKKFSGNSQYIRSGRIMHHGTILFSSNLDIVSHALQVDPDKIRAKGIKSVRSRVTNVIDHLKQPVEIDTFKNMLLCNILGSNQGNEYILTPQDLETISQIRAERYDTWEWNYGYSPECEIRKKARFDGCGSVELCMELGHGLIKDLHFFGDFFSIQEPRELAEKLIGIRLSAEDCSHALRNTQISEYFSGLSKDDFIKLLLQ